MEVRRSQNFQMSGVSKSWGYLVDWGRNTPTVQALEEIAMKTGVIRRKGKGAEVVGRWRADQQSLVVETEDAELRKAADEILKTPRSIPPSTTTAQASRSRSSSLRPSSSTSPSSPSRWKNGDSRSSRTRKRTGRTKTKTKKMTRMRKKMTMTITIMTTDG